MARPSGFVMRIQEQQKANERIIRLFAIQQAKDMMLITMHRDFGFGPDRIRKLSEAYDQTFHDYILLCLDDAKDDAKIEYTKEMVDRALREACGESFQQWDERYEFLAKTPWER